ncbi:MAG: transglycosylase SLT domain-containing protein [Oscillospiraceae bacterium]|nr:transglycosylase SLT domain-containing protein [Oscillospiraceae bacterium]
MKTELTRKEARRILLVAIVIFMMGVIVGMEIQILQVSAAGVKMEEILTDDQAMREGGAMPCLSPEVEETVDHVVRYSVDGHFLGQDLESYLHEQLDARGIGWFYQTALCQIYQESRFNHLAANRNGLDFGLCQFRITYWDGFARQAGLVSYDIMNPIDQIYVYAWMMAKYLAEEGSVEGALSRYYTGHSGYCASYVNDVLQWTGHLQEVKQ